MYPRGRSAQGAYDLSGDVWEWCRNEYGQPSNTQPGGDVPRVLRGGSWLNIQVYARAVNRYINHPDYRFVLYGFRLVCASPIR
jgi:formylglycine-generating enzyme required for sulfatase activity